MDALKAGWDKKGFAYFMEMGTGKSKVAIDNLCLLYLMGKIDTVMITSNKGSYANWYYRELLTHMPESIRQKTSMALWKGANTEENKRALSRTFHHKDGLRIIVFNIEALSNKTGKAFILAKRYLSSSNNSLLIVDESTTIKNAAAQRTKNVLELGRLCRGKRILSGSPVTNSPLDLYSQMDLLSPGVLGSSFYSFRAKYCIMKEKEFGGRKMKFVVGYQNVEKLNELITPYSFRVLKENCLDLPPKIYTSRIVELTDEQRKLYDQIRNNAFAVLGNDQEVSTMAVITQLLRLHQIACGHITDDLGKVHDVPSNRVDVLLDTVNEAEGSIIVWCNYRRDIELVSGALRRVYGPDSVVEYHGGTSTSARNDAVDDFQAGRARFFVGTQSSGGLGITLTKAQTVIYFSNNYSLEMRNQSEDRAHRIGQHSSVVYVDLIAEGTVDERIIDAIRKKIDIASAILGDGYRQWIV